MLFDHVAKLYGEVKKFIEDATNISISDDQGLPQAANSRSFLSRHTAHFLPVKCRKLCTARRKKLREELALSPLMKLKMR